MSTSIPGFGPPDPATAASASASGSGVPRSSTSAGSAGGDLSDVLKGMNNVAEAQLLMIKLSEEMKKSLEEIPKVITDIYDHFKKVRTGLKEGVDDLEDVKDAAEELRKETEKFSKEAKGTSKSLDAWQQQMRLIHDMNVKLLADNRIQGEQRKQLTAQLHDTQRIYESLRKESASTFDKKVINDAATALDRYHTSVKAIGIEFKKLNTGSRGVVSVSQAHHNIRSAFSDAGFYVKPGVREHQIKTGQLAANMKTLRDHRNAETSKFLPQFTERTASGHVDWKRASRAGLTKEDRFAWKYNDHDDDAKTVGTGWLGRRAMRALGESKGGGEELGLFHRGVLGAMDRGNGSVLKGVVSWGMGLGEKGIGMGAGAMALPIVGESLALLSLVRAGFDRQVQINQGIEKGLGTRSEERR